MHFAEHGLSLTKCIIGLSLLLRIVMGLTYGALTPSFAQKHRITCRTFYRSALSWVVLIGSLLMLLLDLTLQMCRNWTGFIGLRRSGSFTGSAILIDAHLVDDSLEPEVLCWGLSGSIFLSECDIFRCLVLITPNIYGLHHSMIIAKSPWAWSASMYLVYY